MTGWCPYKTGTLEEQECHFDGYCYECEHNRSDIISRRNTIKELEDQLYFNNADKGVIIQGTAYWNSNLVKEIITRDVPSEQTDQRWTLCSEGLPKTEKWREYFLVTVECDSWTVRKTLAAEWENTQVRGKSVSRWIWNDRLFPDNWRIIAWKPLPGPYQGSTT